MPTIQPVNHADLPRIVDIVYESMKPISLLRATGEIPDLDGDNPTAAREGAIARFADLIDTNSTHFLKAVDDETGEIAAFAIWIFFAGPEGKAKWMEYTETPEKMAVPCSVNEEGYRYAWGVMHERYREIFGGDRWREHYHLALLATHPACERRGAGSKLLDWAFQQADKNGLECHVESSPAGYALYSRKGFKDTWETKSHISYDVGKFTGIPNELVDLTAMVRPRQ